MKTELKASDLLELRWVLDPSIARDGQVIYVLKDVHPDDREERYHYQLVHLDASQPASDGIGRRLLPRFDAVIRAPKWAPSSTRIAFLSNRSGSTQIWSLDLTSGELARLIDHQYGVTDFEWSPDGSRISYAALLEDQSNENGEFEPGHYRAIRRLGYKQDGRGYWNGTWPQIFLVPVPQDLADVAKGASRSQQLTNARYGESGARWSPDGTMIASISSGEADPDRTAVRNIFVRDVSPSEREATVGDARQLTTGLAIQSLSWSPNGRHIAFVGDDLSDDRATNAGIWVVGVENGRVVNLTADIDRPAGDYVTDDMNAEGLAAPPAWSEDGTAIVALMSDRGRTRLVRLDFPDEEAFERGCARSYAALMSSDPWRESSFNATPLEMEDQRIFAFDFDGANRVVVAQSEAACPGDIFVLHLDPELMPNDKRRLTEVNRSLLAQRQLSEPEPVAFTGSEGRQIEGWLLKPTVDTRPPYPLILHIHGGPHSAHSMAFNFELQHLAAQGYAVLFTNPHGSHSYGRAINSGTRHDWGGKDFYDLMRAVDITIERDDIDADRIGVAGGSYGGWMTNYIVTRTNRFRAAVAQRSSSNRISTMLSSMSGYKHQRWEAPGYPWEQIDYFVRISPVLHADRIETPLLLIHSENDHLCPLMQAEEMYTALKCLAKPVELLVFLGESHHLSRIGKPGNRVVRLERTADWFNLYV